LQDAKPACSLSEHALCTSQPGCMNTHGRLEPGDGLFL
jgi:hypothetical protein